jgi:hypothetical protein
MAQAFKSKAQMERCRDLVNQGVVSQDSFNESLALTDLANLPERLHPKKVRKKKVEEEPAQRSLEDAMADAYDRAKAANFGGDK